MVALEEKLDIYQEDDEQMSLQKNSKMSGKKLSAITLCCE